MNKTIVLGNLGKDAEIQTVNSRKAINFNLAYTYSYTDEKEVKQSNTTWYDCTYWLNADKSSKIVEYLKKGTKILVEGVVSPDTYKNKDGKYIATLKMNVQHITLAGSSDKTTTEDKNQNSGNRLLEWINNLSDSMKNNIYSFLISGGSEGDIPEKTKEYINSLSDENKQKLIDGIESTIPSAIEELTKKDDDLPF